MKESPRQAWMRSRQKIESAQQINQQKHQQQQKYFMQYKPSVQKERQQIPSKSWNSSPNINHVNSSYDELPESHRMDRSRDNILETEMPRGSKDSLLERNLSTTDVQISSQSSPPPAYNGQSGPPIPNTYKHAQLDLPQYNQVVMVNGHSPQGSNEETTRYQSHEICYEIT